MKVLLGALFILLAIATGVGAYIVHRESELDSRYAVLRFERMSSFSCVICAVDVFVNKVKVGSVRNGRTQKFRFTPNSGGENEVFAKLISTVGPNIDSNAVKFTAIKGTVVYARYEINPWVLKLMSETRLEVAVEKVGPDRLEPPAGSVNAREPARSLASFGSFSRVQWDAVGAIASVLSVIAAIITLFRPSR